jgi:hypothetical protein
MKVAWTPLAVDRASESASIMHWTIPLPPRNGWKGCSKPLRVSPNFPSRGMLSPKRDGPTFAGSSTRVIGSSTESMTTVGFPRSVTVRPAVGFRRGGRAYAQGANRRKKSKGRFPHRIPEWVPQGTNSGSTRGKKRGAGRLMALRHHLLRHAHSGHASPSRWLRMTPLPIRPLQLPGVLRFACGQTRSGQVRDPEPAVPGRIVKILEARSRPPEARNPLPDPSQAFDLNPAIH